MLWGRVAKHVLWKAEEKRRSRGWGLSFRRQTDNVYTLRSLMWADNYWLFCHDREILVHLVNDIIEELLDLDMEPKPESLWWTSSYEEEGQITLKVTGRGKEWDLPFMEVFDVLGYRFQRDGKGTQGVEKTLRKGMGCWWRDAYIYRSKSVSLKTKCQRVVSHVFSTALNSSVNWNWTNINARAVQRWETKILRLTLRPKMLPGEEWVTYKRRTARMMRIQWKEMGLTSLAELCAEKIWKTMAWVGYDGTVLVMKALRSVIDWRTTAWWRTRSAKDMKDDPLNVICWKHKWVSTTKA